MSLPQRRAPLLMFFHAALWASPSRSRSVSGGVVGRGCPLRISPTSSSICLRLPSPPPSAPSRPAPWHGPPFWHRRAKLPMAGALEEEELRISQARLLVRLSAKDSGSGASGISTSRLASIRRACKTSLLLGTSPNESASVGDIYWGYLRMNQPSISKFQ